VVASEAEAALWREHARALWDAPGAIVRAAWLPASLGGVLAFIDKAGAEIELAGRAAIGAGLLRIGDDAATQRRVIDSMRRGDLFRHVVVLRASSELKQTIDVWGELGDAGRLGASVKRMLDPNGILNAGRGPV
jgi:hypothetical protein